MSRSNSFLFDASFFHSLESVQLEAICGLEGIGIYLKLLCALREAEGASLDYDSKTIAKLLRCSKKNLEKILKFLLEKNIFILEKNKIFSEKIKKDLEILENKKEKLKNNSLKRWLDKDKNKKVLESETENSKENKEVTNNNDIKEDDKNISIVDANAMQLQCNSKVKDKDKDKDKVKEYIKGDYKGEKRISIDDIQNLEIPTRWNELEVKDALGRWIEYKRTEKREPYKSLAPVKALLTTLEKSNPSTELVVFAIDYAMAKGWKGVELYPAVVNAFNANTTAKPKELSVFEQFELQGGLDE